jgi:hypothetical protein
MYGLKPVPFNLAFDLPALILRIYDAAKPRLFNAQPFDNPTERASRGTPVPLG